jgi:hypothetical protein
MSAMSVQLTSQLLELPPAWLALLFRHVASGPGGIANAAALSQTCKSLHSLSEGFAVTYSNIILAAAISCPDHPFWQWLAKRNGRVAGLSLELHASPRGGQLPRWVQRLQTLSGIPGVQLRVDWKGRIVSLEDPCMSHWLKQHGQLISHLKAEIFTGDGWLKLMDFAEAAGQCRSIDLRVKHSPNHLLDLADLDTVAGALDCLTCQSIFPRHVSLRGVSALNSMSQLTALHFAHEDLGSEEPWGLLARLTSLRLLILKVRASGDPSPLSALTGLTTLKLQSLEPGANGPVPFSFSSLQPLSTLQQLKELHLGDFACAATALQGLAGLSKLQRFDIVCGGCKMSTLQGISPGVIDVSICFAPDLVGLAGIEGCSGMEKLLLDNCGVSSLQPLRGLSRMEHLRASWCCLTSLEGLYGMSLQSLSLFNCSSLMDLSGVEHLSTLNSLEVEMCGVTSLQPLSQLGTGLRTLKVIACKSVQEEVLELPHVQPRADVTVHDSNVKEVVLAGGVRRTCIERGWSSEGSDSDSDIDLH